MSNFSSGPPILALVFILWPTTANAEVPNYVLIDGISYDASGVTELAKSIWPEHAGKLSDPFPSTFDADEKAVFDNLVIAKESHVLNPNQTLTYVEHANGLTYSVVTSNWYLDSSSGDERSTTYRGSLFTASGSSSSHLLNFKYKINKTTYDAILDYGTHYETKASFQKHGQNSYENKTRPAYYAYQIYFKSDEGFLMASTIINLSIRNNQFEWSSSAG